VTVLLRWLFERFSADACRSLRTARRLSRSTAAALVFAAFASASVEARPNQESAAPPGGSAQEAPSTPAEDLRLVVVVVIDQLRGDSLERYSPIFGDNGFRRLMESGVWYQNAHYTHAHTVTAVGHATVGTGASPSVHGIIGNDWIDRETGRGVGCVSDSSSPIIGTASETGHASPRNLRTTTFADEWVFATAGRARAFGVSGKDRGAILPVGKSGKAFWYHSGSGRMVSSRYYYSDLPKWVADYHSAPPVLQYAGMAWERKTTDSDGVPSARDDRSFETNPAGLGRAFPHQLDGRQRPPAGRGRAQPNDGDDGGEDEDGDDAEDGARDRRAPGRGFGGRGGAQGRGFGQGRGVGRLYDQLRYTPFCDELVLDFAFELARAEELGRRDTLDILSISLSANDTVGHAYGPDSVEAKEMAFHLDRLMARLLSRLDETFGREGYLLVLTSDHGVGYSPEAVTAAHFDARRIDGDGILRAIRRRLNFTVRYLDWTAGFGANGLYFDPEAIRLGGVPASELESTAWEIISATPGIESAFTRTDILAGRLPSTDLGRRLRDSYFDGRSPDVIYVLEPYWLFGSTTASHGTPHKYDSHVPIVFYGGGLAPKRITRAVDVRDIAPTLTAVLGCTPPSGSQGEPLEEVTRSVVRRPHR